MTYSFLKMLEKAATTKIQSPPPSKKPRVEENVDVRIRVFYPIPEVAEVQVPVFQSLERVLASSSHLCARTAPEGMVAAVSRRNQVAILWTPTDYGLMDSIKVWFGRAGLSVVEIPLQDRDDGVGKAVVSAQLSGRIPVYTCLAKHAVDSLVATLSRMEERQGCVVVANNPYSADESALRRMPRAIVHHIAAPSEKQSERCLMRAVEAWRHASEPRPDIKRFLNPEDARKAIIDCHLDFVACFGSSGGSGSNAKDVVARGPMEQTEAGVWEEDPEGILEYAWCVGVGCGGRGKTTTATESHEAIQRVFPQHEVRDKNHFEELCAAAALCDLETYANTMSVVAAMGRPYEAVVGCAAGQALLCYNPRSRMSREQAYKANLFSRRKYNAARKQHESVDGRDRTDVFSCLRYETVDVSRFTTPSKAFRRLLAVSGVRVVLFNASAPPCPTPCLGRSLAEHFGITEGINNLAVRMACSALSSTNDSVVTADAVAKDVAWANSNPVIMRAHETYCEAALRD
jgi:hypothetical protein